MSDAITEGYRMAEAHHAYVRMCVSLFDYLRNVNPENLEALHQKIREYCCAERINPVDEYINEFDLYIKKLIEDKDINAWRKMHKEHNSDVVLECAKIHGVGKEKTVWTLE